MPGCTMLVLCGHTHCAHKRKPEGDSSWRCSLKAHGRVIVWVCQHMLPAQLARPTHTLPHTRTCFCCRSAAVSAAIRCRVSSACPSLPSMCCQACRQVAEVGVGWGWCSCKGQETEMRAPFTPPLRQRQAAMASHRNTATRLPPAHLVHCVHVPQRPPHHAVALEAAAEADLWVCECRWWGGVCVRNVRWWVEQRHHGVVVVVAHPLAEGHSHPWQAYWHVDGRAVAAKRHHTNSAEAPRSSLTTHAAPTQHPAHTPTCHTMSPLRTPCTLSTNPKLYHTVLLLVFPYLQS